MNAKGFGFTRWMTAFLLVILFINALFFLQSASIQLRYPYSIDEVEGSTWASVDEMDRTGLYPDYREFPYVPTSYPPLYYLAAKASSFLTGNAILAGRLVSLAATLATALITALMLLAWTKDRSYALIGGLLFLVSAAPAYWGTLYRVDALMLFFIALGTLFAITPSPTRAKIAMAALCFLAAWFTKQTAVLMPIFAFAFLLWRSRCRSGAGDRTPRTTYIIATAIITILAGVAIVAFLQWITDGRYWHSTMGLMSDMTSFAWFPGGPLIPLFPYMYWGLLLAASIWLASDGVNVWRKTPFACFLALAALVFIAILPIMLLRRGGNTNYFMEPHFLLVALAVFAMKWTRGTIPRVVVHCAVAFFIILALPFAGNSAIKWSYVPWSTGYMLGEDRVVKDGLAEIICGADGDVLSDDLAIPITCGKRAVFEPFLMSELAKSGKWDDKDFVADLQNGRYRYIAASGRYKSVQLMGDILNDHFELVFAAITAKPVWDESRWEVYKWKQR